MRTIMIIGLAAGFLTAALPAQAADSTANANAARSEATAREQPRANSEAERPICVRETRSESHIRREICHTAREWRDLQGGDSDQS
jgi:hypothetical protein